MPPGDFDFLHGAWRVRHRKLARRLVDSAQWLEFEGETACRPVLGGLGNVDENVLEDPAGAYQAMTLRLFDPAAGKWSIWWVDDRFMRLGPPVHGRFEGGEGRFLGEDAHDGRPVLVRFLWTVIDAASARWEQAFSPDGGRSWETNWIMRFERR